MNGVDRGTDELDTEFSSTPRLARPMAVFKRGLSAHGRRQERVGTFALDDLFDRIEGNRFNVGPVGKIRVGHDRGRIAVDQDDAVALFFEALQAWVPE